MSLKEFKCPSCGAKLRPEKWKDNIKCEYCFSTFSKEKDSSFQQEQPKQQAAPPPPPPVYTPPTTIIQYKAPPTPRPKLGCFLTTFLLMCGFWPGIIYIVYKLYKKAEWDRKYG